MAEDANVEVPKFKACDSRGSAGFFWVDTSTGMTWKQEGGSLTWRYVGQPEGAKAGPDGTCQPHANPSGQGIFVLNVTTGEGWWTDGATWKSLGAPKGK